MSRYGITTVITRDLRDDMTGDQMGEYLAWQCDTRARAEGYEPAGEHTVTWQEITQADVDAALETLRREGETDPTAPFEAGDWRVLCTVATSS